MTMKKHPIDFATAKESQDDDLPPYQDEILRIYRDHNDILFLQTKDDDFPISNEFKDAILKELTRPSKQLMKTARKLQKSVVLEEVV